MKLENKNFLYNVAYQLFTFIIPLIITPYISRVLGAENLGISSLTYSIVNYFMLGTLLGINNYGSRSIAKTSINKNKEQLSHRFCSIYYLQFLIGIIMLIIYNIAIYVFFTGYRTILLINNIYLISSIIDINWFFFGMEKFKITVSRNIIIKILSLVFIFIFVKTKDDLIKYVLISSIGVLISQIYMWFYLIRYIKFTKVNYKDIISNLKPCLVLFIPVIAYSIYKIMDKTMLGLLANTTDLGYYHNAELIINIPIGIITALGTVMIPNVSKISDEKMIKEKIIESFKLCFFITIPIILGIYLVGTNFSIVFFGTEFKSSGTIMNYLAITILFIAIANVIRTNYLIPQKKDKIYVVSTIGGAIINFIINIILIPKFSYIGASIGTIFAELAVMIYQIIKTKNQIDYKEVIELSKTFLYKAIIMIMIICIIGLFIKRIMFKVIAQILIGGFVYFVLNYKYVLYDFFGYKKERL